MNRHRSSVLLLVFVLAAAPACGSTSAVTAAPAEIAPPVESVAPAEDAAPEVAPPPFTAAQIRAATEPGRTYVFRIAQGDGPTAVRTLTFTRADDAGATLRAAMTSLDGAPLGPPTDEEVTWDELVGHALWPQAATTIEDARVEVPAGAFDARLYTVREVGQDGGESVLRAWFATSLPGAPVRFEQSSGGKTQFLMELLEHRPGTAP